MKGYLLSAEHFIALKDYISFLNSLPSALEEIRRFSESFARSGHQLVTPPNAELLAQAARGNRLAWLALQEATPLLGRSSVTALKSTQYFIDEFRIFTQGSEGRRQKIDAIDPLRFDLANFPEWTKAPPANVIDLMRELDARLLRCESAINTFRRAFAPIGVSLHGIFVRFIESLSIALCSCDGPIAKIEAYYTLGKIGLPNLQYQPNEAYSQSERLAFAREHLAQLRSMRARAANAVDCLNDYCYGMQQFLAHARRQLQNNHPLSSWSRSNLLLTFTETPLKDFKFMSDDLLLMAQKLKT
jgi:hypothetical protein